MLFPRPNRLGEAIMGAGAAPVRALAGRPEPTVAEAGDLKVAGPGISEGVYQGQEQTSPQAEASAISTAQPEQAVTQTQRPPDAQSAARQMHPELFGQYDALIARRDEFRRWIDETNNPPQSAFEALDARYQEPSDHLEATKNLDEQRRIRTLIRTDVGDEYARLQERQAAFAAGGAEETPELAAARRQLMDADYRIRDLLPEIQAAYRRAADYAGTETVSPDAETIAEQSPGEPQAVPAPPAGTVRVYHAGEEPSLGEPRWVSNRPDNYSEGGAKPVWYADVPIDKLPDSIRQNYETNGFVGNFEHDPKETGAEWNPYRAKVAGPSREEMVANVAKDVRRQLVAAGMLQDQAEARSILEAAFFDTLPKRGQFGTAQELYEKHGPIWRHKVAKPRPSVLELAQEAPEEGKELGQSAKGKISLAESRRPLITLFKDADFSTLVHEGAHNYLEILGQYAEHPEAGSALRDDWQTLKDWRRVNDRSEIKTRQHERFARGVEQYVREGIAPSPALARAFAQFKQWMVAIYIAAFRG
jgi:hypothetical protein